ncbi:MAG: hypothetical protein KGJ62_11730 [Armatimonadetes bacterium]|nr:hypothetical protein [Armatimonadota bacterium]MDE2207911.1 hypothetical protein [Armatimonadota bacterium]
MHSGKITITTVVLMVVLIGAIYGVGRVVTPAPPGPPPPAPKAVANLDPHQAEIARVKQMGQMAQTMRSEKKLAPGPKAPYVKPPVDPVAAQVTPAYWLNTPMGAAGEKTDDARMKKAQKAWMAYQKRIHPDQTAHPSVLSPVATSPGSPPPINPNPAAIH